MANKKQFTEEQQAILRANPYTKSVTSNIIHFTLAFKEFVVEEKKKNKLTAKEIYLKAGYDLEILGEARISHIIRDIMREAHSEKGLKECGASQESILAKNLEKTQTKAALKEMQKRIAHLEQEIEVLKKIQSLTQKPK